MYVMHYAAYVIRTLLKCYCNFTITVVNTCRLKIVSCVWFLFFFGEVIDGCVLFFAA